MPVAFPESRSPRAGAGVLSQFSHTQPRGRAGHGALFHQENQTGRD